MFVDKLILCRTNTCSLLQKYINLVYTKQTKKLFKLLNEVFIEWTNTVMWNDQTHVLYEVLRIQFSSPLSFPLVTRLLQYLWAFTNQLS